MENLWQKPTSCWRFLRPLTGPQEQADVPGKANDPMTQWPDDPMAQSSDGALLRTVNLTKIFRSGDEEIAVFEDLNLEVREGEFVALVGESGTGKTTLLHLLAALDTPTRGEVYFMGQRLNEFRVEDRAAYRNVHVGFVWQMHYLLPEFSALENVVIPQLISGRDFSWATKRAKELLGEVGLANASARRVGELSGGEQQRVALARALANQPAVLLADEPTGNLDQRTAQRVIELLERLHRDHDLTSVLATHNLDLARRAHRILRLANGKLTETVDPIIQ
jgi:lipoprotein-releasing system ATP-binding protein